MQLRPVRHSMYPTELSSWSWWPTEILVVPILVPRTATPALSSFIFEGFHSRMSDSVREVYNDGQQSFWLRATSQERSRHPDCHACLLCMFVALYTQCVWKYNESLAWDGCYNHAVHLSISFCFSADAIRWLLLFLIRPRHGCSNVFDIVADKRHKYSEEALILDQLRRAVCM